MPKKKDPKVGTGKKPKGSGRRLYTDENPKDTVSIKFATPRDARATVAKVNPQMALLFSNVGAFLPADFSRHPYCPVTNHAR